ncbi:MAG: insulinase family protein [Bacteroidales bacterium]|nr:insulinase family protein [Bacteroidales bacterium]
MRHFLKSATLLMIVAMIATSCGSKYNYESVQNDPLKARIYTLDNGLKVYMTVNKEEPRIQTYIAVKVGCKNDPHETTGLAHYFEHLMFKGTQKFGTQNYETEKPMLDEIERLFEVYRNTTDSAERVALYHQIDSVSQEASKISIPNEYDKLMAAIGASGTNAWTSFDETVYTENIPSNQIDNWAKIQADRFENNVIRGFHTELETVYEEYNMSLTDDGGKTFDSLFAMLYRNHPYGLQTTLGTQENLKNPSITNIKNYHDTYYVPNNIAICLSGDFDPDSMITVIDKYFGLMKPNADLPKLTFQPEEPITQPVEKEIVGLEAENVSLAWRCDKANSQNAMIVNLISALLNNGQAGLMDVDLVQSQKVLDCQAWNYALADYGIFYMGGTPKSGQTLEEVKALLLEEMAKLRNGDFDEGLIAATVANYKLGKQQQFDNNNGRAYAFINSFINEIDWKDVVNELDNMSKITKADIVKYANENFTDNNFVVVYKRQGIDESQQKIEKPTITPIATNRDVESAFLTEIKNTTVQPIEPVFLDFNKDLSKLTAKNNIPVLYKKNETTDLFSLIYVYEVGSNNDPAANMAFDYLEYLGTGTKSLEEINRQFYEIACNFNVYSGKDRSYITISGLNENMTKAMELFEEIMADAQPNDEALENLKMDMLKERTDAKLDQRSNFNALTRFATYGTDYIKNTTLTDDQIKTMTSTDLLSKIQNLVNLEHRVLYYGPMAETDLIANINQYHQTPETLLPIENQIKYYPLTNTENSVLMAQYDAKQIYFAQISNRGEKFDAAKAPIIKLYQEYFGGNMSSIVFQEMREARGLAYSANAYFSMPNKADETYSFIAFIATQNDKMSDAIDAFEDIINNMPQSEPAFNIAKSSILANYETQRVTKSNVLWSYINAEDLGLNYDIRKNNYETIQTLTLDDVVKFQQENIKGRAYTYCILGDKNDLNLNKLNSITPIQYVSQETIFGY